MIDPALLESLLQTAVVMAVPLLLAGVGELLVERTGVINVGVEGLLLVGALSAALIAWYTGSPVLGALAALGCGCLGGAVFAWTVISARGNAIVVGTALNLLAFGGTGVVYRAVFGVTGAALSVPGFDSVPIPALVQLPVVGVAFFDQPLLGYFAFAFVPITTWFLFRTLPGVRCRMAGENPAAAAALGVNVARVRALAVVVGAGLAGLAGAYLVLGYTRTFIEGMSAGRGFIALALVIFGAWHPFGVSLGALLFGMATAVQFHVQALGWAIPYQFSLMLPYALTLLVLALRSERRSGPAALGQEEPEG